MKKAPLIAVLIALLAPTSASAVQNPIARAYIAAVDYWHQLPACSVTTSYGEPHLGPGAYPTAPGDTVLASALVVPPGTKPESCQITLNPILRDLAAEPLGSTLWRMYCDVYVHEYGHLLGNSDWNQPADSITNPTIEPGTPNFHTVPEC